MPFLTAEWLNVAAITFAVEEERLRPYLPGGATIDSLEGSPRVSLVAFEFRRTRVARARHPAPHRVPRDQPALLRAPRRRARRRVHPRARAAAGDRDGRAAALQRAVRARADDAAARTHRGRRRARLAPLRPRLLADRWREPPTRSSRRPAAPPTGSPTTRSASAGAATAAPSSTTSRIPTWALREVTHVALDVDFARSTAPSGRGCATRPEPPVARRRLADHRLASDGLTPRPSAAGGVSSATTKMPASPGPR